jgi:hypothetical protein
MKALIEILRAETEALKAQYLEMTETWAISNFAHVCKWAQAYQRGDFGYKGEVSKQYHRLPTYIVNGRGDAQPHIAKALKTSAQHYEASLAKLAARIEAKGLNQEALEVLTASVGINIEITLTDGKQTVRAFTIVAEGQVNRPHYRYLIK